MAQLDCSAITAGYVAVASGGTPTPGTTGRVVLMSYNDIDRGRSTVTGGVISGIILKSGKKGYEFDTLPNAVTGDASVTQGTYINTVSHSLALRILAKNQNAKDFVNQMVNGLVVAQVGAQAVLGRQLIKATPLAHKTTWLRSDLKTMYENGSSI